MTAATTPYPVAARGLLRDTLLDAAAELLAQRSWPQVTMADVARAAGVSRQTLYKEFGTRGEFAQACVLRESDRFLAQVEDAVAAHADDAPRALQAAFDAFLAAAAGAPLVHTLLAGGDGADELLPLVTTEGQPLVAGATERLAEVVRRHWPQVGRADALLLAESLVRLAISHATLPAGPAKMDGRAVRRLLGPYVEGLVSRR